jgi:hypothetical protein
MLIGSVRGSWHIPRERPNMPRKSDLPEGKRPVDRFVTGIPLVLRYLDREGGTASYQRIREMLSREASDEIAEYAGQVMSEMLVRGLVDRPEYATYALTAHGKATLLLQPKIDAMIRAETERLKRGGF